MKRSILIAVVVLFTVSLSAQSSIDKLFSKYQGKSGFTTVTVGGNLFKFLATIDDDDDEMVNIAKKFTSVRILTQDDDDMEVENFYDMVIDDVNRGGYEEMVAINSEGDDIKIMLKSEGKVFKEFLMISGGKSNAIIQIKGNLTYDDVKELSDDVKDGKKGVSGISGISGIELF